MITLQEDFVIQKDICECPYTWIGGDCSVASCPQSNNIACGGRGDCVLNSTLDKNLCNCKQGWSGPTCSIVACPTTKVGLNCTGRGICNEFSTPPSCDCSAPYYGNACQFVDIPTSAPVTTGGGSMINTNPISTGDFIFSASYPLVSNYILVTCTFLLLFIVISM